MTLSNFVAYVKQLWKNKPDTSTPLSAERLTHLEEGIKGNSDAIQELAAAVVSQIVNNPDKIASMAALYAVDQKVAGLDEKIGDTSKLPAGTTDAVGAIAQLYSNLEWKFVDSKAGVANISLPSTYKELLIGINVPVLDIGTACATLSIPKIFLSPDVRKFPLGGYWEDGNAYGFFIEVTNTYVKLLSAFCRGYECVSSASIYVYYR